MPVSPQDFALWSNLTGNPYPQTPAERMALAPQVYEFNRNLGRSGGPVMSPARRAVDVVGKAALAAGALAGAAYLGSKYLGGGDDNDGGFPASFGKLDLDNEPAIGSTVAEAAPDLSSQVVQNSGDITPITTAGRYSQNLNPNQTSAVQEAKGLSSFKPTTSPIEEKPATQSEVIATGQHFSPGTEEEMLGQNAAERAAAFRKSKAYAMMQKQYPSLREPDEELIGGPGGEPETVVITEPVRQPAEVRVAKPAVVVEESPVAAMASVKTAPAQVSAPVSIGAIKGPSTQEIREMDTLLARTHARHTPEQRADIRNKYFAEKFGGATAEPIVTTTQPSPVRVAVEPTSTPAKVKVNQFLSKMSQEQGPVATYEIDPSRSKAVSGMTFYPGGELGITHPTKKGDREYAYNVSDPMRLAMSDYAEENFPSGFGSIGALVNAARNPVWLGQIKPISR